MRLNFWQVLYNWLMDIRNDIKYILSKEALTLTNLARLMTEKTGKKYTVNSISGKLIRESITLKEALEIFDIAGYDLVPKKRS